MQLYVGYPDSAIARPAKQLRGFKRIHLAAGETQTVTFTLRRPGAHVLGQGQAAVRAGIGMVDVMVGASSGDIRQTGSLMTHP